MRTIKRIIIHHTASSRDNTTLQMINDWHKARWEQFVSVLGYNVGYHWVIGNDWIKQTRLDNEDGAHCLGHNGDSIGIALTGNFENETPTKYQIDELKKLIVELCIKHRLSDSNVYLHKNLARTLCPGKNITKSLIKVGTQDLRDILISIIMKLLRR